MILSARNNKNQNLIVIAAQEKRLCKKCKFIAHFFKKKRFEEES